MKLFQIIQPYIFIDHSIEPCVLCIIYSYYSIYDKHEYNGLKRIAIPKIKFPLQFNAASCPAMEEEGQLRLLDITNFARREITIPMSSYLVIESLNQQNDYEIYWSYLKALQFKTATLRESLCVFSFYFPIQKV